MENLPRMSEVTNPYGKRKRWAVFTKGPTPEFIRRSEFATKKEAVWYFKRAKEKADKRGGGI